MIRHVFQRAQGPAANLHAVADEAYGLVGGQIVHGQGELFPVRAHSQPSLVRRWMAWWTLRAIRLAGVRSTCS
ncbi:hypothetical protein EBS57_10895 [bacterium]|nr:hypothetical protein [bacterium]